ncbi:Aspartate transaminase [Oleidesulfovibrio alaskensis G20]|jgi:aspartate aminotransferase|uniref:Aminotransferase n=1 Tax=Oleidesulfovibrio alaskensis (strain ATCC BAA-1058 / DSM 17464 / G20) TaxID=207559 RepID=Q313J2_OLEA2|nr:pyridoxal phosphate-dependent aminotransferase [Oleidesulfovibrio alaskensis]ABB37904.2 Aspartate transaminase [Oleidesulfovibrio alaskensis G20]MBG0772941.1 pyridoxal phosphate-dependent aminotransferase [Oleidesulfovibrio alaskensis]MBL3582504.1 pyridoxal phosphate-dependent aminotransferase [Oleidesulfovibrio alaskensis]
MSLISAEIAGYLEKSSWIRKMFEAGIALKKQYGEQAVCDFSLGNPDLPAPPAVGDALRTMAENAGKPFAFGYMPNGGFQWAREALAGQVSAEQGMPVDAGDLLLSCGAAGALNAFFRAVLEPGDEVLAVAPYFVEYGFYVSNHQGVFKTAMSRPETFELDIEAVEARITPKTRALIINSPNNPTGVVYSREELEALAALLERKSRENGRPVYLIADEPYRFLSFDGVKVPSVLPLYPFSVVVNSFSKNLSLAGERLGYICLSPLMENRAELMAALTLTNRILGFVNPPVIGQHVMAHALGSQVDVGVYAQRRDAMAEVLSGAGYQFSMPKGAFYFFPKAPGGDDVEFCRVLMEEKVLAVPGSGFGGPGYFRLTFCVDEEVIRRSAGGFARAMAHFA